MSQVGSTRKEFAQAFDAMLRDAEAQAANRRRRKWPRLTVFHCGLEKAQLGKLTSALARRFHSKMRRIVARVPADIIPKMRSNYSEKLPKVMRFRTSYLSSRRDRDWAAAERLGIIELLQSDRLRSFAESVTGKRLEDDPGMQVICYDEGDFTGPHNDHHPEEKHLRDGYIDVHINLPDPSALSQLLVYEAKPGLLNGVEDMGAGATISIYHLPFWHYVTPLVRRRAAGNPKRWLLLASYVISAESAGRKRAA